MKYLITLLILICASPLFAQQSAQTNNAAVIEQLQERIASIEKQNEALRAEIDSMKNTTQSIIDDKDEFSAKMRSVYQESDSILTQAKIYADKKEAAVDWSFHVGFMDVAVGIIAALVVFFSINQVCNFVSINKRIDKLKKITQITRDDRVQFSKQLKLLSDSVDKQKEQNKEFENVKESIEKMQKEQKELNYDFLSYNSLVFEIQSNINMKSKKYLNAFIYGMLDLRCMISRNNKVDDIIINKINKMLDDKGLSDKTYSKVEIATINTIFDIVNKVCKRIEDVDNRQCIERQLSELKNKALEKFKLK